MPGHLTGVVWVLAGVVRTEIDGKSLMGTEFWLGFNFTALLLPKHLVRENPPGDWESPV